MNKFLFNKIALIIFLSGMLNCNSQTKKKYSNKLETCLSNQDIDEINSAVTIFEEKLTKLYNGHNINNAYLNYINEVSNMKISPDFFKDTKSVLTLEKLKNSGTFDKIWTSLSSTEDKINEDEEMVVINLDGSNVVNNQKIKLITLKSNGEYLKCMLDHNSNKTVSKMLNMQNDVPGLGMQFTSKILAENMTEEDFENRLNRVAISIGFYYELVYMFKNNKS
jgi:hypothetical protein